MYRNTFEDTSRLYNPLRDTLRKSRIRDPSVEEAKSRAYSQMRNASRISKRMRSLSPQEADEITKSTIITEDRQLVPTDHLWKIRGKQFTAVNIDVKQGPPLSQSAVASKFGNIRGPKVITTETVYEMRPSHPHRSLNTFYQPAPSFRVQSPPPTTLIQRPQPVTVHTYRPPQSLSLIKPIGRLTSPFGIPTSVTRVASPVRLKSGNDLLGSHASEYQLRSPPSNVDLLAHEKQTVNLERISTDYQPSKKSSYKYNLFSSLDEAINTGCGSCGSNEVVASKPNSYWS